MENISISFSSQEKDEQETITLVNTSDLNEDVGMDDTTTDLIHHVLEVPVSNGNKDSVLKKLKSPNCLVCNAKLWVSARGAMNIFSKELKSSTRQLGLDILLSSILTCELESASCHSEIICKKCYKLVEYFDELENQLHAIKKELNDKFIQTKSVLSGDNNSYVDDENVQTSQNDIHIIDSIQKGRLKKTKKNRKVMNFSNIKLEVKQEIEDLPNINLNSCDGLQDEAIDLINSVYDNDSLSSEELFIDGSTELDGLDVDYEDGAFQMDGLESTEEGKNGVKNSMLLQMDKYKCRFCPMKSSFSHVQRHLVEIHADRLYECEVCSHRLSSRIQLMEHINDVHLASGEKPYSCTLCPQTFALPRQLKEHLKKHSQFLNCYQCARRFQTATELRDHIKTQHGTLRPFPCDECGKNFASRRFLKAHCKTHGARKRPYKCKKCNKLFYTLPHLSEHSRIHQSHKEHVCAICGKAFSTARSLDSHSLTHTGIKNYACRICQKAFLRKGEVDDHERIHTGEKPFQCEFCGSVFSQRSNLLSHKKATHLKVKKYLCSICDKAFKRRRLLKYHLQSVHTGERPYKCSRCTASFVYPEHYKNHLRIHTGEKPFRCEICNKAFNSKDNKNAHKFIHSGTKQYECLICSSSFMRKPQLISHILQHGHIEDENVSTFIKINPPSVVDEEILGTPATISMNEEPTDTPALATLQIVKDSDSVFSRPLHIVEADMPKYIVQSDCKTEDEDFLASLDGQMVEVRAEDLEKFTQLSAQQIAQISQAAEGNIGEVSHLSTVAGEYGAFEIHLDDQEI